MKRIFTVVKTKAGKYRIMSRVYGNMPNTEQYFGGNKSKRYLFDNKKEAQKLCKELNKQEQI